MSDEMEKLLRFAGKVINATHEDFIGDLDGGTAQDYMEECGLAAPYKVTKECDPVSCRCAEYGFPTSCYRLTSLGLKAVESVRGDFAASAKQRREPGSRQDKGAYDTTPIERAPVLPAVPSLPEQQSDQ